MQTYPKHDEDFYGWVIASASLLRQHKLDELDIEHLIEELESMGASEKRELLNRLAQLLMHLLKWQFQPNMQGHSWTYSIREQRDQVRFLLDDSPSLQHKLEDLLRKSYSLALSKAILETGLDEKIFPKKCPYTFEQLIDDEFFPE